jgi:hypothetical protein
MWERHMDTRNMKREEDVGAKEGDSTKKREDEREKEKENELTDGEPKNEKESERQGRFSKE